MAIAAELLELLACPSEDHAPLRVDRRDGVAVLVCTFCRSSYPIIDGIPVLLLDEATPGPNGLGRAAEDAGSGRSADSSADSGADSGPDAVGPA